VRPGRCDLRIGFFVICVTVDTRLILLLVDEASGSPLAANMERTHDRKAHS
jgi:hypothetical protein